MSKSSNSSYITLVSILPMSLIISPFIHKSTVSKLNYLYKVSYIPNESKITSKEFPLINSYHDFTKPTNPLIKSLIKQSPKTVKEYVQLTKFNQCMLPAISQE